MTSATASDWPGRAAAAAQVLAESATEHDRAGSFPHDSIDYLRSEGWPALPVPLQSGGQGASLTDVADAVRVMATGDASCALGMAMHYQTLGDARDRGKWRADTAERIYGAVVERGALINACASEPELGSPSRGGLPRTIARRVGDSWRIDGRKTFATLAPALDFFVVPAAMENEAAPDGEIGRFLVPRGAGVEIEGTWDPLGMRATGSYHIALQGVVVPDDHLLYVESAAPPDSLRPSGNVWFLALVTAAYLGVGQAAVDGAARFAIERTPTALGRPIATLEGIQRRLGEADAQLRAATALLRSATLAWDGQDRDGAAAEAYAAKVVGTKAAIEAAANSMRVAGGAAMQRSLPLERHFRDAQAGLYHPPSDDAAYALLGRLVLAGRGWSS